MKSTSADDRRISDPISSLQALGETLAATASLDNLARLIAHRVRDASGAQRVALLARDESGRLRPAGHLAQRQDDGSACREVVALPLTVRADVEAIVVIQDAADRSGLDAFALQAAWAIAATRSAQGGRGDAAEIRARIAGKLVHEVNNRLGAIQIYAYLLSERLRRGEDAGGIEVAGKLSAAVERLGTSIGGLAAAEGPPSGARAATDVDALVDGCLAAVSDELAGHGVHVAREPGAGGAVLVHEPSMGEALQLLLRRLGSMDGARLAVATEGIPPQGAAIVVDSAVGLRRLADALFLGESDELGRALVRDVVERQAGTVSVTRTGDDGARIRIALGGAG
jgi:signal transduction histidine kinase